MTRDYEYLLSLDCFAWGKFQRTGIVEPV